MSSSFSTPPADATPDARGDVPGAPWRISTAVLLVLLATWAGLMAFGAVCMLNPPWLQRLTREGVDTEARTARDHGNNLVRRGDLARAAAQYRHALEIKPGYMDAAVNLALVYGRMGREDAAIETLEGALNRDPAQPGCLNFNLGELYARLHREEKAIRCYRAAIGSEMDQGQVYRRLGILYGSEKMWDEARAAFLQSIAVQTDPTSSYRQMLRHSLGRFRDDPDALRAVKAGLARDIDLEDLSRYDLELLRRLQEKDPVLSDTYRRLADVYVELGDRAEARLHYERALRIRPDNSAAQTALDALDRARAY